MNISHVLLFFVGLFAGFRNREENKRAFQEIIVLAVMLYFASCGVWQKHHQWPGFTSEFIDVAATWLIAVTLGTVIGHKAYLMVRRP